PCLDLGEVIDQVVGDPADRLVRRVHPGRLAVDGCFDRAAVPVRPARGQLEDVIHHRGHDVRGVTAAGFWSWIGHERTMPRGSDIPRARMRSWNVGLCPACSTLPTTPRGGSKLLRTLTLPFRGGKCPQ